MDLKGKKVLVFGAGKSGIGAADLLGSVGAQPIIYDGNKNLDKEADRKRTDQSFMVPKKDIVENDYDLSINKYKEIEYTPVEYPPTSEIMANIRELELEIGKEMDELERLLGL